MRKDVQVELNGAMFCNYYEASAANSEFGIIVVDSIDGDELYPYSPATRLRHGVTEAVKVSLEPRKKAGSDEDEELVVVMTRTVLLNLRHTDLPVPPHEMHELYASVKSWGDAMLEAVRSIVYSRFPAPVAPETECELVEVV